MGHQRHPACAEGGHHWPDTPSAYAPPHTTIYSRDNRWFQRGIWQRLFAKIAATGPVPDGLRLDASHMKAQSIVWPMVVADRLPSLCLLTLVPDDARLEAEAFLPHREAGFVHEGQHAEVKLEAFPFTRYGTVPGTVQLVSREATGPGADGACSGACARRGLGRGDTGRGRIPGRRAAGPVNH
jgi:transposase